MNAMAMLQSPTSCCTSLVPFFTQGSWQVECTREATTRHRLGRREWHRHRRTLVAQQCVVQLCGGGTPVVVVGGH